jgi:hypothetical protein
VSLFCDWLRVGGGLSALHWCMQFERFETNFEIFELMADTAKLL